MHAIQPHRQLPHILHFFFLSLCSQEAKMLYHRTNFDAITLLWPFNERTNEYAFTQSWRFFTHCTQCTYIANITQSVNSQPSYICTVFHAEHTFPFFPHRTSHNNELLKSREINVCIFFSSYSICFVFLNDNTKNPSTAWVTTFSRPYIKTNEIQMLALFFLNRHNCINQPSPSITS